MASGIAFAVQIWCIDRGGPVFVAVYQPVQTFVVAIMASIALGEEFYLGGLVLILIKLLNSNVYDKFCSKHSQNTNFIFECLTTLTAYFMYNDIVSPK